MSKKSDARSGRVTHDERGQPVWEWQVATGEFSRDVDTVRVRQLQDEATVELRPLTPAPAEGFDPYSTAPSSSRTGKPRRTLDDMRKLSEEIKKNRQEK